MDTLDNSLDGFFNDNRKGLVAAHFRNRVGRGAQRDRRGACPTQVCGISMFVKSLKGAGLVNGGGFLFVSGRVQGKLGAGV